MHIFCAAPLFPLAEKGPSSIFSSTKRVHYSSLFGHSGKDQIWLFIGKKYQKRYIHMYAQMSILTHLFPSTYIYIYIYQFLPWLVCPIFFPSHDTSKLERDFLLVLNNYKHCTLYISCYTHIFESLLFESKSIDMHFER